MRRHATEGKTVRPWPASCPNTRKRCLERGKPPQATLSLSPKGAPPASGPCWRPEQGFFSLGRRGLKYVTS